jgi:nucleoside-diphosphate-sugar epimerase
MSEPIVLLGANSLVGPYLLQRLVARGQTAVVPSRRATTVPAGFSFVQTDITRDDAWRAPDGAVVLSAVSLWVLVEALPRLTGVRAIIAVGSTSVFGKADSVDAGERATADKLRNAEAALKFWCAARGVACVLLRPTLVYDGKTDKNIARMARFIRRFGFLPVGAPASGLRQPVHADDVAAAMLLAADNRDTWGKDYNIAGDEVMTYRTMAARVFAAVGRRPLFLPLPVGLLARIFALAARLRLIRETAFGIGIFARMNQDLVFAPGAAGPLPNYRPRAFHPEISQ